MRSPGWVDDCYSDDKNYKSFAGYLERNCRWKIDDFGGNTVWKKPIPRRSEWADEINKFNEHLKSQERQK